MGIRGISIRQIRIGPEVPLGRRGCEMEHGLHLDQPEAWMDTYFRRSVENDPKSAYRIQRLLQDHGEEAFTVLKRVHRSDAPLAASNFNYRQQEALHELIELGAIADKDGELVVTNPDANWGSHLECCTSMALEQLFIQSRREVKVRYPHPNRRYDPDGQLYDVLAGLDLTNLMWVECKKPLYLQGTTNPVGQVLNGDTIRKFYIRAFRLRADIAVLLVDTKEDIREAVRSVFRPDYLYSGCFVDMGHESDQIAARLHGFIYVTRVNYRDSKAYIPALKECLSQVLYDAKRSLPDPGFAGDPFISGFR